jgi:hypothetical protein
MEKLQQIACVSKVCTELELNIGVNDKDLAEFVVHLAKKGKSVDAFQKKLSENGADFPGDFVGRIYELVHKMLPQAKIKTAAKENKSKVPANHTHKDAGKFFGLAQPNVNTSHLLEPDTSKRKRDFTPSPERRGDRKRGGEREQPKPMPDAPEIYGHTHTLMQTHTHTHTHETHAHAHTHTPTRTNTHTQTHTHTNTHTHI